MFVETQWLADHINDPDLRVVDVQFTRCFSNHDIVGEECWETYLEGHIPNAVYIDCIKDLSDTSIEGVFHVPTPDRFTRVMNRAGISKDTMVVCYDEAPYPLGSARFFWTMLYYGHTRVKILNGGIREWIKQGHSLSTVTPDVSPGDFTPRINSSIRATKEIVKKSLDDNNTVLIDCLPYRTYSGEVINSWCTRKGHIPGALVLPPFELIKGLDKTSRPEEKTASMANDTPYPYFPVEDLKKIIAQAGIEKEKRMITYCGKGEAACSVFLALKMIGVKNAAVFEGSLAEWSRDPDLLMEKI